MLVNNLKHFDFNGIFEKIATIVKIGKKKGDFNEILENFRFVFENFEDFRFFSEILKYSDFS